MSTETRNCQSCKKPFVIEPDDFGFYEKIKVPPPTWCPPCRMQRRMSWRGYKVLHKRKCDFTGDTVISVHPESAPLKVYRQDIWWSDKWDPKSYGKRYDFSRSFFEQYAELLRTVPLPSLYTEYSTMVQSEYCNAAATLKSCYLCFNFDQSEDCAYCDTGNSQKTCLDLSFSHGAELCYDSVGVNKCYQTFFSQNCEECQDIWFSQDLIGCSNCVGCINLRNKQYCILNEQYTKEEYEKKLKEFGFSSLRSLKEFRVRAEAFAATQPHKAFHGRNNQDASGDYLYNCKNVKDSYVVQNSEDIRYGQLLKSGPAYHCMDYTAFALQAEWVYDSCWVGINVNNVKFGMWDYTAHDLEYCYGCHGSGNLFGCVGIRQGEYCILNRQYTKEEYTDLVEKIKKQMMDMPYVDRLGREYRYGEYMPPEHSPWGYNDTNADTWVQITKEEAVARGFNWHDPDPKEYQDATMQVPDRIEDTTDEILSAVLKCVQCTKNYRLISAELQFYRRFGLPVPERCSFCRDRDRVKLLNPIAVFDRACAKCNTAIKTSYAPDRPEIVYCESCYNAEVV